MSAFPPNADLGNPLRAMPSVLSIRDLQRRWRRVALEMQLGLDDLEQLLRLDPLAVLRGLRAANAPVLRGSEPATCVQGLVRNLGQALSQRLFDGEPIVVAGTSSLRTLWRHAIATGVAAEDLARRTNTVDPGTAYLVGLLHDLPVWLRTIEAQFQPQAGHAPAAHWIEHWQFPAPVAQALLALANGEQGPPALASLVATVRDGERLAELADYRHPSDGEDDSDSDDDPDAVDDEHQELGAIDKADLLAAQRVRRRVEGALRTFGLDPTIPDSEGGPLRTDPRFQVNRSGGLDEVVLSVLGCTRSERYRGIITALTAAAVRYGSYDRAFYARWNPAANVLVLRSKADASSRRLQADTLVPLPAEAEALAKALREERPAHLVAALGQRHGVLGTLGTDELLAVPLNREFALPAFLLLDRSVTLAPIDHERDSKLATTLGLTGSLLNENLLLRRRRQRAQKFAVIDPLTRLYNRRMGLAALEREVARTERTHWPLTVLMCDLDHFKHLNDTYGHLQGDVALRATADVLRKTLRRSDVICRFGGEEFLVVLAETAPDDATVLAARLFVAIEAAGQALGLPMTISIGLTSHRPGDRAEDLLHRADGALYASKDHGRNRFSADIDGYEETPQPANNRKGPTSP